MKHLRTEVVASGKIGSNDGLSAGLTVGLGIGLVWLVGVGACWGLSLESIQFGLLGIILAALSGIDVRCRQVPRWGLLAAVLVWAVFAYLTCGRDGNSLVEVVFWGLTAAGSGFALLLATTVMLEGISSRLSLGGGDIRLMAVLGLYLGFWPAMLALFLGCALASAGAGLKSAVRRIKCDPRQGDNTFPMVPYIAMGAWVSLLWGQQLLPLC